MSTTKACAQCGEQAILYKTKKYHAFSTGKRFFCEKCHTASEKHENRVLILNLVISAALVAAAVFLMHMETSRKTPTGNIPKPLVAARDFNADGNLDLWESQATDQQVKWFNELGYPWETVESGQTPTRAVLAAYPVKEWTAIFRTDKDVQHSLNFPDVMLKFLGEYTDPESLVQIDRVFLTTSRDIAYILNRYGLPPSKWPPPTATPTPTPAAKKASKKDSKEEKEIRAAPPVPILSVQVCYERLNAKKALFLAQRFGVPDDKLTFPYREEN